MTTHNIQWPLTAKEKKKNKQKKKPNSQKLTSSALKGQDEVASDLAQVNTECHLVLGCVVLQPWKQNTMFYCDLEPYFWKIKA